MDTAVDPTRFLTYAEVSARLGIKVETLYVMVHRGSIPHVRLSRRMVRFEPRVLDAWVAEHRMPTADTPRA